MQRTFVLDKNKKPLMPCHPARARSLIKEGKAVVFRFYPFTIILKTREGGNLQSIEVKIDPGSRITGIALVLIGKNGNILVWAAHLHHRGHSIKEALVSRRANRQARRNRKTRYRTPRFDNRTRPAGWLPPSIKSRVDNVANLVTRLCHFITFSTIHIESVRFDLQQMEQPEISGIEYQQGSLYGYEVREYLLEKWCRKCAYCNQTGIPLEIEHIVPKSKGGSNRISNLTIACTACNLAKSNQPLDQFLKDQPVKLLAIISNTKKSLHDAAAVNTTRLAIVKSLEKPEFDVHTWSGGRTKHNRIKQHYPKDHYIDAACVGSSGASVKIHPQFLPLHIIAMGRGSRQQCRMDSYGFPRTKPKKEKRVLGFQTGDLVYAQVLVGKKVGTYKGRVAIRSSGNFNIKTPYATIQGISAKYCKHIHHMDGYMYHNNSEPKQEHAFLPLLKQGVSGMSKR